MVTANPRSQTGIRETGWPEELMGRATFICGHPKSGTSLVMTLLDSHPQLVVYPEEAGYFRRFVPRVRGLDNQAYLSRAEELILHIFGWDAADPPASQEGFPDRDYTDIDFDRVQREFRYLIGRVGDVQRNVLPAAVLAYGTVAGLLGPDTVRWVEKTPYNEQFADRIFDLWPAAKCVHIVRDPRDNFASYRKKHQDWSERTFAHSWQQSLTHGWQNNRRYGVDRYLMIRYEDLIADPQTVLASLTEFLGIEVNSTLGRPTRAGKPWGGNSMFGEEFAGISDSPVGRYQRVLEPASIRRLEAILHPWMREFDYALADSLSLAGRMTGWIVRTTWPLARMRSDWRRRLDRQRA